MGTAAGILFTIAMVQAQLQPVAGPPRPLAGAAAGADDLATQRDAIKAAWADLLTIPPPLRQHVRYLSMHRLTVKERAYFRPILDGHCNKLSRLSRITRTTPVLSGGSPILLRVDLAHYGWDAATWEKLRDPYFTEAGYGGDRYEDEHFGYYDRAGKWVWTESKKKLVSRGGAGVQVASWLNQPPVDDLSMAFLVKETGSYIPVTDARWFFNQTAASADRDAGYNEFLGFNDQKSFDRRVGVDTTRSRDFRFELRESTAASGVATHLVRAIVRDDSLGGGRWKTIDFNTADEAFQALTVLGRDIESVKGFAASEQFGFLPNGLWAVGAFDAKGKAVTFVPGDVANDLASRSNDKRIHNGVSCFRCHVNGGLQDIDEWARGVLKPPLKLNTTDYKKYVELSEQYLRSMTAALKRDRLQYEDAIQEATGLTSQEDAKRYAELWELYEDARVDAAHVARDIGLTPDEFRERLLDYIKGLGYDAQAAQFSLVAASLVHPGRSVPIRSYERVIPWIYRATAQPAKKP